jgi:dienelactone hydrolase
MKEIPMTDAIVLAVQNGVAAEAPKSPVHPNNRLGSYGQWAADLLDEGPGRLSWRNPKFKNLEAWRAEAVTKTRELLLIPDMPWKPEARVERAFAYDGLAMEELSWQLPYGPRTRALFMKPVGAKGRLPAVLALHDHGGHFEWGVEKITRTSADQSAALREHQSHYGGRAWANELARRGYAVLVHDVVGFASRRPAQDEEIFQKSLLCAGTLWAGMMVYDDQRALDYLASRPDVDAGWLACGGLSGGGVRTVFLGGLDPRLKAAFPVGWVTTWRDLMLDAPHNHSWMPYVPGLARELDYPEILGLRVPLHTFVLIDTDDQLFTLHGMQAADAVLREVYAKAGAPDNYRCKFYPGPHKFDLQMQEDAFAWLDEILKP